MYKNIITLTASSLIQLARRTADSPVVFDRPPEGLAQGSYVWPAWGVVLLAASVVLFGALFWMLPVLRARSARRRGRSAERSRPSRPTAP